MLRTVLALALAASVSPAMAEIKCGSMKDLEEQTKAAKHRPVMTGDMGDGFYIIVFADQKNEHWVIIGTRPDGTACRFAEGMGLKVLPTAPAGKEL